MIYLASPYSDPDPYVVQRRLLAATYAAAQLIKRNHIIYSPIVHCHPIHVVGGFGSGWDAWKEHNRAMLQLSKALWIFKLHGWSQSKGVKAEIDYAISLELPIKFVGLNFEPEPYTPYAI